jgi:hypothetical protein
VQKESQFILEKLPSSVNARRDSFKDDLITSDPECPAYQDNELQGERLSNSKL